MNTSTRLRRDIVARLIAQASGRLMSADDPRLSHQNGTGSTGATAEPALNSTTQPTNGVNEHGKAI